MIYNGMGFCGICYMANYFVQLTASARSVDVGIKALRTFLR